VSFGPITTAGALERATEQLAAVWLPYFLAEVARQDGHQAGEPWPATPRTIETYTRNDAMWAEVQLPAVVIYSPGTVDTPERDGRGRWSAWWRLIVGAVVGASTQDHTRRLAHRYAAAIRALMVSHPTIGGVADRLAWVGESYGEFPTDQARTLTDVAVEFRVHMSDVASVGPRELPTPHPDPHDPWPGAPTVITPNVAVRGRTP